MIDEDEKEEVEETLDRRDITMRWVARITLIVGIIVCFCTGKNEGAESLGTLLILCFIFL